MPTISDVLRFGVVSIIAGLSAACDSDPLQNADTGPAPLPAPAMAQDTNTQTPATTPDITRLQDRMDCIREAGALVAAHRGGPRRGYPENALETIQESFERGTIVFEIDVNRSKDGIHFLLHDVELDRTTSATGVAREKDWSELQDVTLTAYGAPTDYTIPSLEDVLDWTVANNAILEIDKKRSAEFAPIIADVRRAGAEQHVILITYTKAQAEEVAKLAPEMMMTASVNSLDDLARLENLGVKRENLIAWSGTETPNPTLWRALSEQGVEIAFGTLGRRGERLDEIYWADRDGSEYDDLVANDVDLIATDYSDKVTRHLRADDDARRKCGL